jgi:hypothetical protein
MWPATSRSTMAWTPSPRQPKSYSDRGPFSDFSEDNIYSVTKR